MPIVTGEMAYLFGVGLVVFEVALAGPVLLLMHFLMPKIIVSKYFKEPYFQSAEITMFTGIPYAPMRTVMLMWILAHPKFGVKRGLTKAYKYSPKWYLIGCRIYSVATIAVFTAILMLILSYYIYIIFI